MSEHHADQACSPTRVRAAAVQGRLHEGLRRFRCRGPTTAIGGHHGGLPLLTEASNQRADSARGEAECPSDGGAILTIAEALPNGLTYGYRGGTRHGRFSEGDKGHGTNL
jgi:hypothetical protein